MSKALLSRISSTKLAMDSNSSRNIVVIGGGIIGCTSAYFLTRHPKFDPKKHTITILEASSIAGGASGKAGGLLALWAYPNSLVPLSYRLHESLAQEHDGARRWGYRKLSCGQLVAKGRQRAPSNDGKDPAHVSLKKRTGAEFQKAKLPADLDWFSPEAVEDYEAMSGPDRSAQVHPKLFTQAMSQLAADAGAKIIYGRATKINASDAVSSVSYISDGKMQELPATDVVVAAGPWTRAILPEAPISALRAHSVTIRPTRPVSAYALFTEIAVPSGKRTKSVTPEIYARPDGEVYACGEGDTLVPLPETTADVEVDPKRCEDIIEQVGAISDELRDGEVTVRQACYLPSVDSGGGPMVGLSNVKGLVVASGHTCWGIQNGPGTGKLVSEFVFDGKAQSAKIGNLDPRQWLH